MADPPWRHLIKSPHRILLALPAAGLLTAALAAPLHSQTKPQSTPSATPTIKVETRVVLVDVVVTDRKGAAIPGLRQQDFQVLENGKPQSISAFDEHKNNPTPPVDLPVLPPNLQSNRIAVKSGDSVNVLLIDMLNTQPWYQKDVYNQVARYLETVPAGTQLAIFTLNVQQLRLVRGFSTDTSAPSPELGTKDSGAVPESAWLNQTPSRTAAELKGLANMIMMQASPAAVDAVKQYLGEEVSERASDRTELTLQAFQHLARYLSGIPARKNVIWFADSFPITFIPEDKSHAPKHQEHVQQTCDMLTAAQVAIYPISAHGIESDPTFQVTDLLGNTRESMLYNQATSQIAAEGIAQETGGRAFYNTNGLDVAMAKAMDEGSHYYTIAYAPANNKTDGKYRRIEVRISDREYKLSFRRGYYADDSHRQKMAESDGDPLIPLIGFGMPNFDQITYQVEAAPVQPQPAPGARRAGTNTELADPVIRYAADLAVSLRNFSLETAADGSRRGRLEVMLVAYDRTGKIVNISKRASRFALPAKDLDALLAKGLPLHLEIDVPPGDIYLRTGIYDLKSGSAGTLGFPLPSPSLVNSPSK